MFPGLIIIIVTSLMFFMGYSEFNASNNQATRAAVDNTVAANEAGMYRTFVRFSSAYMLANPAATGLIYWSTIAAGAGLGSSAITGTNMPSTWHINATGGTWVLCTDFKSQNTPGLIGAWTANLNERLNNTGSGTWVLENPGATSTIATEASEC